MIYSKNERSKLNSIINYIKKMGWVNEYIYLNEFLILCEDDENTETLTAFKEWLNAGCTTNWFRLSNIHKGYFSKKYKTDERHHLRFENFQYAIDSAYNK